MKAPHFAATLVLGLLLAGLPLAGCNEENASGGGEARAPGDATPVASDQVLVHWSRYVSPLVEIFGEVFVGADGYVGPNTVLRAAPELSVEIGNETNAQDNVLVRARTASSSVGDRTSLAHHAIVRDSRIGDFVFFEMSAEVVNSTIGDGAFVQHGAYVQDVEIPGGALVSVGQEVTTQAEADALPQADASTEDYRRNLLEVNAELAHVYVEMFEAGEEHDKVIDVGPNPETSFNTKPVEPELGDNVTVKEFVHIVGDVRIGADSHIGQRTTLRADEGTPIVIGENAEIDDRVSFHALRGTEIRIGDDFTSAADAVLHGPLQMGDGTSVEDRAVVFRAVLGDNVQKGDDVLIVGPSARDGELPLRIPDGAVIPEGSVITSPEDLQQ